MECAFTYHIIAVKYISEDYKKQAPFATLCYHSDGELFIDYHLKFE